ncbi:RHS repeat-associated core domain-containing protein [Roseiconus lacunae]|uniref:RHS repeat-associated core domain-containing protein n=1 Tax=Roseiconus lacunae TaxID=2605694 RepID=A0ABT7PS22_9BACT|nr:RHS repeat-associated core domain-containing protein [Roseiconus lacunae]MDM4019315.1 RHS repeat-associated core domain-containing protein [Roseiconus lacunae]
MIALHNNVAQSIAVTNRLSSLGYSGEHFDAKAQQQYLRARFYNPANGRFNRLDLFAGNMQDPQSLHKYAYVHGDPIQGTDPSGLVGGFSVGGMVTTIGIGAGFGAITGAGFGAAYATAKGLEGKAFWKHVAVSAGAGTVAGAVIAGGGYALGWGLAAGMPSASALALGHGIVGIHPSALGFILSAGQFKDATQRGDTVDQNFAMVGMIGALIGGLLSGRSVLIGHRGQIVALEFGSKPTTPDNVANASAKLSEYLGSLSRSALQRGQSSSRQPRRKWSIAFDGDDPNVYEIRASGDVPNSIHPDAQVLFDAHGPVGHQVIPGQPRVGCCSEARSANALLFRNVPKERVKIVTVEIDQSVAPPCRNCGVTFPNSNANQHAQNRIANNQ